MQSSYLKYLSQGITLITPTRRMAALVADRHHSAMRDAGQLTWESPAVLPFAGWLTQTFQYLAVIEDSQVSGSILLSLEQERVVWEQVVREGNIVGADQVADLAVLAMNAWSSVLLWKLPFDAIANSSGRQEVRAFVHWADRFQQRCRNLNAVDHHSFAAQLAGRETLHRVLPEKLSFFGYSRLPPLLQRIEQIVGSGTTAPAQSAGLGDVTLDYREFANREIELGTAMRWARECKRKQPHAALGIALAGVRHIDFGLGQRLQRAFSSVPIAADEVQRAQLYCPVAEPLAEVGIVEAALLILDSRRSRPWDDISRLLLSPYFGEADREREARALLDARLRQRSNVEVGITSVIDAARSSPVACPDLVERLEALARGTRETPRRARMHEWMAFAEKQLSAAGWPGTRELSPAETVAMREWQRVMDAAAELDAVLPTCTWPDAASRWRAILRSRRLLPPAEVNAVQVLTLEEAAFLDLDALWIAELHDGAWPDVTTVSPLIPFALQRSYGLPGADPDLELQHAHGVLERLHSQHPSAIWSYARLDGETQRRRFPKFSCIRTDATPFTPWSWVNPGQGYDVIDDSYAATLAGGATITGGVGIFTDQAACPMRAFARHRLQAKSPEDPSPGLNAMQRGSLIHAVMARLWTQIGSSSELQRIGEQDLQRVLKTCTSAVVEEFRSRYHLLDQYWELEHERLQELSGEWLSLELERGPFEVVACEQSRPATIGGYTINTRVDRIDRLANGQILIVDYKTGEVSRATWAVPRPDQPQLPLYAVTSGTEETAGIAYARVKKGACRIVDEPDGIAADSTIDEEANADWRLQLVQWRKTLECLAGEIESGLAVADPKRGATTCRHCDLQCLCRIHDVQPRHMLERGDEN